jgi:hypothetical protein
MRTSVFNEEVWEDMAKDPMRAIFFDTARNPCGTRFLPGRISNANSIASLWPSR